MPARKRLALLAAAAALAAIPAAAVVAALRGHPVPAAAIVAVTALAAAAALEAYWPRWHLAGRSLRHGPRRSGAVALTFDDGPGPDTPAVLDALDAASAKATFFVLGRMAEARPDLVREIARRGHLVASHGLTHRKLALAGPRTIAAEIDGGLEAIRRAGVEPAPFFRAPHGFKGPLLDRALRARGLLLVAWTRGVWDTERPGAGVIAARASAAPRGGEILLLHDGCGTPGLDPRRDQTAAAVPEIVRRWRTAGFRFVTVDALASAADGRAPSP